jgi:glycosyltransferase involved in cell wall biosynthesis
MKTLTVLFVHHDGKLVGSAISLHNLIKGLDNKKVEARVLLAKEGPARRLFEELGVNVDAIPMKGLWTAPGPGLIHSEYFINLLGLLPNLKFAKYLVNFSPDVVHINEKPLLSAGYMAKLMKFPVVWHLRSTYFVTHSRLQAFLSKVIIRHSADRLIAISEDEIDGFEDLDKLRIVYNSVDLDLADESSLDRIEIRYELKLADDELLIGNVGLLNEAKGAWDFITAAGITRQQNPGLKIKFVIVARIPDRSPQKHGLRGILGLVDKTHPEDKAWNLAREYNIEDDLILTGYRKDVLSLIAAMDVVVVADRLGVMGRQPIEAMAMGKPVVATAGHSGKSRIVVDGETALVVPPANPRAIADAITNLIRNPMLRKSMGDKGRLYSREHFDHRKNADRVLDVYEELLSEKFSNR